MVDVRNVRGGTGLDPIAEEVDELLDSVFESTTKASEAFFEWFDEDPDPSKLARFMEVRCWREIDYVFLVNEQIRRYGFKLDRKHITLLAKQSFQEAEHYEGVGKAVESLGGTVPTSPPPEAMAWSQFLWDCMDRHWLGAIAAWNLSETSAGGSFEPIFKACEKYGFEEVDKVHRKIAVDEKFHVGLGRQILATYAETDEDREEILYAMRGMRDIAWRTFTPESVAAAKRP